MPSLWWNGVHEACMIGLRKRFQRILDPADIRIDGDRPWDVRVHDERLFKRVLATGTLGFGEAYMDGWWSCRRESTNSSAGRPDTRSSAASVHRSN